MVFFVCVVRSVLVVLFCGAPLLLICLCDLFVVHFVLLLCCWGLAFFLLVVVVLFMLLLFLLCSWLFVYSVDIFVLSMPFVLL